MVRHVLRSATSCLLSGALAAAPVHVALAGPAVGDKAAKSLAPTKEVGTSDATDAAQSSDATDAAQPSDATESKDLLATEQESDAGVDSVGDEAAADEEAAQAGEGEVESSEAGEVGDEEAAQATAPDEPASEPTVAPAPTTDPALDARPAEPRIGNKPRKGKGLMIAGGTVLGVGLASTITFGMITQHCSYGGPLNCRLQGQDDVLIPAGVAVTLLGAMLLSVGVGYNIGYKRWERWTPEVEAKRKARLERRRSRGRRGKQGTKTAFAPGLLPQGGGVVMVGRF